ncbi:MAG: hypothetical protein WC815_23880 [Vicinamibacterales bacterium]
MKSLDITIDRGIIKPMMTLPKKYRVRPCGAKGLQVSLPAEWIKAESIEDRDMLRAFRDDEGRLIFEPIRRERVEYAEGGDE